ncbi:uncharacterized protein LOC116434332 [Nomia melanderi]|uniref:uncharacterized protein LOC116434332 n=1 Tax=Nomia melanderi TaxID=2448451 RepID=UPI003FCD1B17
MTNVPETAQLKGLKRQRATIKGQLTRIETYLGEDDQFDIHELQIRKEKVIELNTSFENVQSSIELEDEVSDHDSEREQFERNYFKISSLLNRRIERLQTPSNLASTGRSTDSPNTVTVRQESTLLPKIEIKPYDGNPIEWHSFHDTFKTLVHDNLDLPAVQKFHLLKNALRGEIASVITSLNASEPNYRVAWDLLQRRCNRPRQIVQSHLKTLFELPEVTRDAPSSLRSLAEQAQMHVNALATLGQPVEQWDAILVYLIGKKLDKNTRRGWERTLENDEMLTFEQLVSFVNKQARGEEIEAEFSNTMKRVPYQDRPLRNKVNARGKCNQRHNTLLHFNNEHRVNTNTSNTQVEAQITNAGANATALTVTCDSEILLGTARIKILDKFNKEHECRVLLDGGSQTHFITSELAEKLQLCKHNVNLTLSGLGQQATRAQYSVKTIVKARNSNFSSPISMIAVPSITGLLPSRLVNRTAIQVPQNIALADPEFHKPGKIDALLGNTLFFSLLSIGQIKLNNNSIILQKTRLGWIVTGKTDLQPAYKNPSVKSFHVTSSLDKTLNKFWEIEEVAKKSYLSEEERAAEISFKQGTRRDADGRYCVRLPFNENKQRLGSSREIALKRFYALERKLHSNQELLIGYREFLKEYEQLGHMTQVSGGDLTEGFYLPHHAVIKESSETTKIRVVFDASSKTSTGIALNDALLNGPILQDTLYKLLLRFRSHSYVLTADVEKMFRQIRVHTDDRKYQRILWRDSRDKPIRTYELNTVTYGTTSAPFLAVRCLQQLAVDEQKSFPVAADVFRTDFYVDDLLTGAPTREQALKIREEAVGLARLGGFHLRQWTSNDESLVEDLESSNQERTLSLDIDETRKALGIGWNPRTDELRYSIKLTEDKPRPTKRTILSQIAQLFDPLGLLGPVIVHAKIIMQRLWKADLGWDESVPQSIFTMWVEFMQELPYLNKFSTPRKIIVDNPLEIQLHGFCDASEAAYGACIYLRSINKQGDCKVNLLCAKSRVAPVKTISLPRLELCAAKLLANLVRETINAMTHVEFKGIVLWSDSTIALNWIRTPPHTLKTFVANRVSEIQEQTDVQSWRHISSIENPADFISRGQTPLVFLNNPTWLKGPQWLSQAERAWPFMILPAIEIPETRSFKVLIATVDTTDFVNRFSTINKLNRVLAYILRFYNNCKSRNRVADELTSLEISNAHVHLLKLIQEQEFAQELKDLREGREISKKSKLLNLTPFIDEKGLIRVGGRLKHASIKYTYKHPILLPRNNHVTELIVRHEHLKHWHAGIQATLNAVRQRYWPIDGKNLTRRLIHACINCVKTNPKLSEYVMGNLPKDRVTQTRPFETAGVDYCEPFFLKERKHRNVSKIKGYVVVFVCFATKATHLELVTDLTTEACIAAIKRFFARRGRSRIIYSDNGSNFIGANNEIRELTTFVNSKEHKGKLKRYLTDEGVNWSFSPPRSPHFGGLWEAAVKAFKRHLKGTIGDALFTYEQLNSIIIEIEAILNSRPLTPLSSDPNDYIALTPAHFLIGDSLQTLPEYEWTDVHIRRLSLWQHTQRVKQHFWSRWHREYLHELHTRSKWHIGNSAGIKEGTLVLIREDNLPPLQWKLGRILEVHPGDDKIIRVVTVKTPLGVYKRSVKRLAPLPID